MQTITIFSLLIVLSIPVHILLYLNRQNRTKKGTKNSDNKSVLFYGLFTLIFILVVMYGTWEIFDLENVLKASNSSNNSNDLALKGIIGDAFGIVNALFSGLAFSGLIITIILQSRELKLQRKELSQTKDVFKEQSITMRMQQFENTFFNMLSQYNQIVNDFDFEETVQTGIDRTTMKYKYREEKYNGRDFFRKVRNDLEGQISSAFYIEEGSTDDCFKQIDQDKLFSKFFKIYNKHYADLGHYFRNLYRIIKLIDEHTFYSKTDFDSVEFDLSKCEKKNYLLKYKYTSIVRAQLSDDELILLMYNCLTSNGVQKFKPLIEKYSLLKNMSHTKGIHKFAIDEYYHVSSYIPVRG